MFLFFFFSSRRRHTRSLRDWSSDVCSSDLPGDRRVKRLVLTPAGAELKERIENEVLSRAPWRELLTTQQRASLLALLHTMSPPLSATEAECPGEGVSKLLADPAAEISAAATAEYSAAAQS